MPSSNLLSQSLARANVRASEGAGTTTLGDNDARWQVFNLSAARTVVLPGDGRAGDTWQISNVGTGVLTLQSSGLNTITVLTTGYIVVNAAVSSPSTAANWLIGEGQETLTGTSLTTAVSQATPVFGTYYDLGAPYQLTLPPGSWRLDVKAGLVFIVASGAGAGFVVAIRDTSNNIIVEAVLAAAHANNAFTGSWGGGSLSAAFRLTASTTYKMSMSFYTLGGGASASNMIAAGDAIPFYLFATRL